MTCPCREGILAKLQVGKKVFLAVVILESLGLFIAGIMRWIGELDNPYRLVQHSAHIICPSLTPAACAPLSSHTQPCKGPAFAWICLCPLLSCLHT